MHVKVLLRRLQNRWMHRTRTSAPMPLDQQVIDAVDLLIDDHHLELASELRALLPHLRGGAISHPLENAVINLLTPLEWAEYDPDPAEVAQTRARIALARDVATTATPAQAVDNLAAAAAARRRVCISGSMRFDDEMRFAAAEESVAGHIVLMPHVNTKTDELRDGDFLAPEWAEQVKPDLDALHLDKIDLADEVLVICPGGYIGDSTSREIEHAERRGKPVRYWPGVPDQRHGSSDGDVAVREEWA